VLLVALTYVFAVRADTGRRLDDETVHYYLYIGDSDRGAAQVVAEAAGGLGVAPLWLALVAFAYRRRGRRAALVAVAIPAAAIASARVLKWLLVHLDPLGFEQLRSYGPGFFPSGHSTAITALALVLLLLVAPGRMRAAIALVCGGIVAFICVTHVVALNHHPTDLVGGSLVAAAWALALSGFLHDAGADAERPPRRLREGVPALLAAVAVAIVWAVETARLGVEQMPMVATAMVAVAALAVIGAFAAIVPGMPRRPAGSRYPDGVPPASPIADGPT
jgi:undecaprenyl-diphosphatase